MFKTLILAWAEPARLFNAQGLVSPCSSNRLHVGPDVNFNRLDYEYRQKTVEKYMIINVIIEHDRILRASVILVSAGKT